MFAVARFSGLGIATKGVSSNLRFPLQRNAWQRKGRFFSARGVATEGINDIDWDGACRLISSQPVAGFDPEEVNADLQRLTNQVVAHCASKRRVPEEVLRALLKVSTARHAALPNVVSVRRSRTAPSTTSQGTSASGAVVVVGDTHGQFFDFQHLMTDAVAGPPSRENRYVVNGDVVDRGSMAVEILSVIMLQKLACDVSMTLLRGNHETDEMFEFYGFAEELDRKYSLDLLTQFNAFFEELPVAAVVEDKVFVVHGGLSPDTTDSTIEQINKLDRKDNGSIRVMLWSDPKDGITGFRNNSMRGGGYVFGADVTQNFLFKNGLSALVRSHQCEMNGIRVLHGGRCITVFSAANYCGDVGNLGAVLLIKESPKDHDEISFEVKQFEAQHYPLRKKRT